MKSTHTNIFISRLLKLSLNDKIFTDKDVIGELKNILMAVIDFHLFITLNNKFIKSIQNFLPKGIRHNSSINDECVHNVSNASRSPRKTSS